MHILDWLEFFSLPAYMIICVGAYGFFVDSLDTGHPHRNRWRTLGLTAFLILVAVGLWLMVPPSMGAWLKLLYGIGDIGITLAIFAIGMLLYVVLGLLLFNLTHKKGLELRSRRFWRHTERSI